MDAHCYCEAIILCPSFGTIAVEMRKLYNASVELIVIENYADPMSFAEMRICSACYFLHSYR